MINKILIFAAGVAIGSAVTWKLVKDKYKKLADEEIASVKEVWSKKHPASEGIAETDVKESVKTDITQQPKKNPDFKDYRAMQEIIYKNSYKEEDYMDKCGIKIGRKENTSDDSNRRLKSNTLRYS